MAQDLVLRFDIPKKIDKHRGCVNTLCFKEGGDILISGSDDRMFCKAKDLTDSSGFAQQMRPSRAALKRKADNPSLNISAVWSREEMNRTPNSLLATHGRLRSKYRISNGDHTWVLTAKSRNGYSRGVANISLEVNEAYWEDKHISLVEDLAYQGIIVLVGEDKADVELPFKDRQYLCGTWVCVRRVLPIRGKRTKEIPRVLSPGIWFTRALVTLNPTLFMVLLGLSKPDKKKSFAVTSSTALQMNPFTNTAKSNYIHYIIPSKSIEFAQTPLAD
ncbi:LOW QUALITY PROTEIN: transducin/WD-like repeat-protein [Cinnamomum micranthum f. kanehirae]|uniref:Transducin/WD-like repeat-protein n=1 Tax=Cinnamomum micranthum f. kanehirae TaxID=337451 RepID=A0A3S3M2P0_9MAGN|nr:LOW QUALITY PROTEIN: transducin/WD-like repeat-protein [Cinnamomum micranthum f. kanehirae]